jgi:hypothetical protein
VASPRDEIWIDMMQFDAGASDRLWEGGAPAPGAPPWYGDVSELIETAAGPPEPDELTNEPVVVEDMHRCTRTRAGHRGRAVCRVVAMKTAATTAASVLGFAAAAAATTGIVATVARVVVPLIEQHVLPARQEPESAPPAGSVPANAGGPDVHIDTAFDDQWHPMSQPDTAANPVPVTPAPATAAVTPPPEAVTVTSPPVTIPATAATDALAQPEPTPEPEPVPEPVAVALAPDPAPPAGHVPPEAQPPPPPTAGGRTSAGQTTAAQTCASPSEALSSTAVVGFRGCGRRGW